MFYNIPCVKNMIDAIQLGFLGKVVRGPINRPTCSPPAASTNAVEAVLHTFITRM
jgi:hypothetical protein